VSIVGAFGEVAAWVEPLVGAWRYLLSPAFRARTHEAWRHEHLGYVVWDVFWGMLGFALSLMVGYFVATVVGDW